MQTPVQTPVQSTIARIVFATEAGSAVNYVRIVTEMEQVLARLKPDQLTTTWDCDDLVFFDLKETRIGMATTDFDGARQGSCLTVSVGPRPGIEPSREDTGYDVLCSRIVERLESRFMPIAVLWTQTDAEVTADLIDALSDDLPLQAKELPPVEGLVDDLWQTADRNEVAQGTTRMIGMVARPEPSADLAHLTPAAADAAPQPVPVPKKPAKVISLRQAPAANDMPPAAMPRSAELARLRDALYAAAEETAAAEGAPMSNQMRLAVHALNATLIVVWLPLGAAAMSYSLLRGENLRVSGRLMALTGTLLAFSQLPLVQSVAAAVIGA